MWGHRKGTGAQLSRGIGAGALAEEDQAATLAHAEQPSSTISTRKQQPQQQQQQGERGGQQQ